MQGTLRKPESHPRRLGLQRLDSQFLVQRIGELVEKFASIAFGLLAGALLLAWLLDGWLRDAEWVIDRLVLVAHRLGDVGAAFHRLVAALKRAWEQWQGKP